MKQNIKVIISGGGSGGHIFPAIAIAQSLEKEFPNIDILFIGAKDKMEMEKVPAAGYNIEGLWISGFQRSLSAKNLSFPFKLISSLAKAKKIIKKFKPDLVIGVGGFASGPTLYQASKMKIPCLIQEQNSFPGITNRLLAKRVDKICVAYENMDKFFPKDRIVLTGNPVRESVVDIEGKKDKALSHFELETDKQTVLVVGGSLGARTINESIQERIDVFADNDIQLIWQTGKNYYKTAIDDNFDIKYNGIKIHQFINRMDLAYAAADLVVSRAGAIAISELSLVKKPIILVPSPFVAEDHQTKNAMALVNNNAAILVKDKNLKKDLTNEILRIIADQDLQKELIDNITKLGMENSTKSIIEVAKSLIK
jgi:UDP-N-acetylglucosamine--N-acetylmuramyl-(pentapeptide) pyrophosphoryl-undecaprenol N-acetylglucosamine transferase